MKISFTIKKSLLILLLQISISQLAYSASDNFSEEKYRIEHLEQDNAELKKKIEDIEKNSRSVEQFRSVLEIHEKSMNANDRNTTWLSIIIGLFSITIPILFGLWNWNFMNDTKKRLKEIEDEAKTKVDEMNANLESYQKQAAVIFSSLENKRKAEKEKSAQESYQGISIEDNKIQDLIPTTIADNNEISTNPDDIRTKRLATDLHDKLNRAMLYRSEGNLKSSLQCFDEITQTDESKISSSQIKFYIANAHFNKGVILSDMGKYEEALTEYNNVIDNYQEEPEFDIQFLCVKSNINKLSLLLMHEKYNEVIVGYEIFLNKYENNSETEIKIAVARAYYNYLIALWKNKQSGYLEKIIKEVDKVKEKFTQEKEILEIQVFLARILNLLIFILGEESRLDESISEFKNLVMLFPREVNPNIILEIEKSFNDQIDLFTGIRNFEKIAEMCNIVTNNLQSNMHFKALVERAQKIKSQI